jgi:hypothetical protein
MTPSVKQAGKIQQVLVDQSQQREANQESKHKFMHFSFF